jgi:hypothetical protein
MKLPVIHILKIGLVALGIGGGALGCGGISPGPDKQGAGMVRGAVMGAGTGAITGAQLSSATGPGAAVGAGLGAVAGGVRGAFQDIEEEKIAEQRARLSEEKAVAGAQRELIEHMARRAELHPTRDLFPADLFFYGDEVRLCPAGKMLVREIAQLHKEHQSWSRLVVAAYVKARDEDSGYGKYLAEERSKEIVNHLVTAGIEGRRLLTRSVIISEPVLIDPLDRPARYNQAVEFIPLDR